MKNNYTYFQATNNAFWRWEEGGDVVALSNGSTIAYKGFIVEVIKSLEGQGIPPFGVLLLAIIATNDRTWSIFVNDYWNENKDSVYGGLLDDKEVLNFQQTLAKLPAKYKKGEKRLAVFRAIFERGHNLKSVKNTKRILKLLEKDLFDREDFIMNDVADKRSINNYRSLGLLNRHFPDTSAILRAIAGLPTIPDLASLEILETPEGNSEPKDFVDELVDNYKTFQLGALIKRIWSGMNIPMHAILPNEQKLGGVSDLTNKGTFDKLLISEFAYDDLTFMSRLANQEALYLNRERPPNAESQERIILIDTSIKSWGTPRTIAYAIMVAIAKHPKSKLICRAFVLGRESKEIAFDNIHDIIDALNHLDTALTPIEGLEAFFKDFKSTANNEVVLITLAELLEDGAFKKTLIDHHRQINYLVTTDHLGRIDFYKNQQRSRKHIQHLVLPLVELWDKKNRPKQKGKKKRESVDIEGIDFPILFPPQRSEKFLVDNNNVIFVLSTHKKLFQLSSQKEIHESKGWNLICERIPRTANVLAVGQNSKGTQFVLYCLPLEKLMVIINLKSKKERRATIEDRDSKIHNISSYFYEDKFVFKSQTKTWFLYPDKMSIVEEGEPNNILSADIVVNKERTMAGVRNGIPRFSVIRRLTGVKINNQGDLVINNHALNINIKEQIRWKQNKDLSFKEEAKMSKEFHNTFEFLDGSKVELHEDGILVLKSSNDDIPIIYIPTVLDRVLGLATENRFAGSQYYLNHFYKKLDIRPMAPLLFYQEHIEQFVRNIWG